ncbi:MAG: efflux RND transporter periplasmic adaptor subunit, partial [Gammaproteobacteria bacterium]|nr:efflux RND transporter periplasmic adaptor subunit [Gammaproteobacteria bacterium]
GRPSATTARDVTLTAAQRGHITLDTVAPSAFHRTILADGTVALDADRSTPVLAPFSGPVERLLVSTGEHVTRGEALAIVDSPDFAAAASAYRKSVAAAATARRLADLEARLLRQHGISQRKADQAESDAIGAEADRDAARRALIALGADPATLAAIRRGRSSLPAAVLRAPIAGTIVERRIHPGELLQAGSTPCFTVGDLSQVWVDAQIFGTDVAAVHVGDPARIRTGTGGTALRGTVTNVAVQVDPATRSVLARITVPNPGDALKRHQYVRVRIRSRRAVQSLLVPVSAVLRDSENLPFVYVLVADGRFARHAVQLGGRDAGRYRIDGGLRAGERVVTDGALFLQFIQNQ